MSFKRPYHYYAGGHLQFRWRKSTGKMVPIQILPKDLQSGGNPWVFQPLDKDGEPVGDPVAIEDKDIYQQNQFTLSQSGVPPA